MENSRDHLSLESDSRENINVLMHEQEACALIVRDTSLPNQEEMVLILKLWNESFIQPTNLKIIFFKRIRLI